MNHIISNIKEVTSAWLTEVLVRNGHLKSGEVTSIEVTKTGEASLLFAHLSVRYSENAIVSPAMQRLFIKYPNPNNQDSRLPEMHRREITFYSAISRATALPVIFYDEMQLRDDRGRGYLPVIPCYGMQLEEETGRSHLLLADISSTHMRWNDIQQPTPTPVLQGHVACLARLHAAWWEHPQLGQDIGKVLTPKSALTLVDRSSDRLKRFRETVFEQLSAERRAIYERMIAGETWSRLLDNLLTTERMTLTHGDPIGNILYPRDPDQDEAILIDWQFQEAGLGTDDLAFFLILSMAPSHSRRVKPSLMAHYYDQLRWHGVNDYSWEQFEEDYCRSVVRFLTNALFRWNAGWGTLDRTFTAFEDLNCVDLL